MIAVKPRLKRYLLLRVPTDLLLFIFASAIGFALAHPLDFEKWWPAGLGILLGGLVGMTIYFVLYFASCTIILTDQQVGGNGRWSIFPTIIPLKKVDVARSRATKTSLFYGLLGHYEIRSIDGKAISVDRLVFGQEQFDQLLDAITAKQQAAIEGLVDQPAPHGQHMRPTRRPAG